MKHRTIRKAFPLLVLAVMLLLVVESQLIVIPNPTRITFDLAGQRVPVTVRQTWSFFDKTGRPLRADSSSDQVTLTFETLRNPYPVLDTSGVGWIIVKAEATLENDMPTKLPSTDRYANYIGPLAYFLTDQLTGEVSINGNHRADIQFVPWERPSSINNFNMLSGSGLEASVAFMSGDKDGQKLTASFWIITTPGVTLQTCQNYPKACLNLSSEISSLGDFKIQVDLKESWKAWVIEFPMPSLDPLIDWNAYWNACAYKYKPAPSVGTSCTILLKDLQPVSLHWEAMMSEFCILTNGTCSITKSETTVLQVTVSQTLIDNEWIIVRKYSFTTVTDTAIVPSVGEYSSCTNLFTGPLAWLCNSWNTIPYWLIILGIILVLAFFYAPAPRAGRVGIIFKLGGGRKDEDEDFVGA